MSGNSTLGQGIARVDVNVLDLSSIAIAGRKGVTAVVGITERGTPRKPQLVRSWIEFVRYFGGFVPYSNFPYYCKRALDAGATLLVSRVAHYNDVADVFTLDGQSAISIYTYSTFGVYLRAADFGAWGNKLRVSFSNAGSGATGMLDVTVRLLGSPQFDYTVTDVPAAMTSADIDKFNERSRLMKINQVYGTILPTYDLQFQLGYENYTNLNWVDYAGDPNAGTGFNAFNDSKNYRRIAVFEPVNSFTQLQDALIEYAENNALMSLFPAPLYGTGWEAVDFRNREGVYAIGTPKPNSWKTRLIYGAITVTNPLDNMPMVVSTIADVVGALAKKDNNQREWFSEAGSKRGLIGNNLGIFYNLGTAARKDEADAVDNAGITMCIDHDTFGTVIWGNGTLFNETSLLKHANIAELVLLLHWTLKGLAQVDLFDPNDVETWKAVYRKVSHFMDFVKAERGVYDYKYDGDQDVDKVEDATVNDQNSIMQGAYTFNLFIKPTPAMKYIGIQVVVTNSNVDLNLLANEI